MQFHDYLTHFQVTKHNAPRHPLIKEGPDAFTDWYIEELHKQSLALHGEPLGKHDPISPILLQLERDWHAADRPYYNLWPSIIPALTKLKMDADCSYFRLPLDQLLVRFPKQGNPLTWRDKHGTEWGVRAVLAQNTSLATDSGPLTLVRYGGTPPAHTRAISFFVDIGEPLQTDANGALLPVDAPGQLRCMLYKHLVCEEGKSIEWSFWNLPAHQSADMGVDYPERIVRDVARILCTLCLMSDDANVVEPIVLKADEEKFEKTQDAALVDKARRRGNYGFNVGRSIEVIPHVRSASPAALYWTGEGRKVPRIRFRRGTVVHRKRLAQVPTGFLDQEEK